MRRRSSAGCSGSSSTRFAAAGKLRWRPAMESEGGLDGRRVLFISYNGMLDPLGQTQVIPYLRELAKRGVRYTLLSFERPGAFEPAGVRKCEELKRELAAHGIEWHWLRYHQRPSVPATIYEDRKGVVEGKGVELGRRLRRIV